MHHEVLHFIYETKILYNDYFVGKRVVEIGSRTIQELNGQYQPSARCHFENCEHVGVDISKGLNVDVLSLGHEYRDNKLFDVVISCECFEHDPYLKKTVENMVNHLKPGGMMLFTCASTGRAEHGTRRTNPHASVDGVKADGFDNDPFQDYYKNLVKEDFDDIVNFKQQIEHKYWVSNEKTCDLYFRGWKKY